MITFFWLLQITEEERLADGDEKVELEVSLSSEAWADYHYKSLKWIEVKSWCSC